jgi:hypothetical protein
MLQVLARRLAETLQAELLATAQRRAHERESFQQVFEQAPSLIALLQAPRRRFEYVNPAPSFFPVANWWASTRPRPLLSWWCKVLLGWHQQML